MLKNSFRIVRIFVESYKSFIHSGAKQLTITPTYNYITWAYTFVISVSNGIRACFFFFSPKELVQRKWSHVLLKERKTQNQRQWSAVAIQGFLPTCHGDL